MGGRCLVATLFVTAAALAASPSAYAENWPVFGKEGSAPTRAPRPPPTKAAPKPKPLSDSAPIQPATDAAASRDASSSENASPANPVIETIIAKLAVSELRKGADAKDLAALQSFYATRSGPPLWATEMGLSAKGQALLFEIEKATDWGLDPAAFELPSPDALTASSEEQALAEIKLNLALLKYARFARGGRLMPAVISKEWDQSAPLREPKTVMAEITGADAPAAHLQSLHPKHEQFVRLRQALLKARGRDDTTARSEDSERDIKRLILNMERWRFMPEDLGSLYVWSNTPEFMLYVMKDGKAIYADKTQVGTIGYQTPVFSADMKTIVFNPEWIAPPTVLRENLLPALRRKNYALLEKHGFSVSYQGNPVNPAKVDWAKVNIHNYTFIQKPGPHSNVGKAKFLYPNKHIVYMHDTFPERRKYYQQAMRAIGHDCVRMERPDRFSEVLLAEDKGWSADQVRELWDKSVNKSVAIERWLPVHMTYFTAVVDGSGKVATFDDLYGLDNKLAAVLFGSSEGFPMPPPEKKETPRVGAPAASWSPAKDGVAGSMHDFLGN